MMEVGTEIFVAMSSEPDAALLRGSITDSDDKSCRQQIGVLANFRVVC